MFISLLRTDALLANCVNPLTDAPVERHNKLQNMLTWTEPHLCCGNGGVVGNFLLLSLLNNNDSSKF